MAEGLFMRASEVAAELGICSSSAYKLIQKLNEETGCIVIKGRIDRKFFHEKIYATKNLN